VITGQKEALWQQTTVFKSVGMLNAIYYHHMVLLFRVCIGPGKSLNLKPKNFCAWKVVEKGHGTGKLLVSDG